MRNHVQGFLLLCLLAVGLWGMTLIASNTITNPFASEGGDDEVVELVVDETPEEPLDDEERVRLQFHLLIGGSLDAGLQVDGIIGPGTRAAMEAAAADWGLDDPSDRELLEYADENSSDEPLFPSGDPDELPTDS